MDICRELEKLIAIYFNGENYIFNGIELSREDSKIIAYSLIHALQIAEMIMKRK